MLGGTKGRSISAVYDLSIYPVTFDFIAFLANANAHRESMEADGLDVFIISEWTDPIQGDSDEHHPASLTRPETFIHNFITEAALLFPAVRSFQLRRDRKQFVNEWPTIASAQDTYPPTYNPLTPDAGLSNDTPPLYGLAHLDAGKRSPSKAYCLTPTKEAMDLASRWLQARDSGKFVITITLREAQHDRARNSHIENWQKAIDTLGPSEFTYVVLRDYSALFSPCPLRGETVFECNEAVISLPFRAALYEQAFINLMTNSGPASLCYLNHRCNYLVFMEKGDFKERWYPAMAFQHGVEAGEDLPHATPARRLCWSKDEPGAIVAAVNEARNFLQTNE